jgi:4-hydroxy-3-methylbut-2-en-1-yl diphosphate reductase
MNRSAVRDFQAPGVSVQRGEVLVPVQVGDPARGPLPCPAAPLIAGSLLRKGWRCTLGSVPRLDEPGSDLGGAALDLATLYLATCPQRDGSTAALAAATAPGDRMAAAAASSVIEEWAAVIGTRRLLITASPWCGGAGRALDAARSTVADYGGRGPRVCIYGELAAPPEAAADLAARGAVVIDSLAGLDRGDVVIFPAHGVPPAVRATAIERGLTVVDATCPLVAQAQDQASRIAERGDDLVLIGRAATRTAAAITGHAGGRASVVETAAGAATLQVTDARRVSYLLQPGGQVETATAAVSSLRSRFPAARGPHPDGFCYAPSDRALGIRSMAAGTDLMLVLGDADSADVRHLSGLARDGGARVQVLGAVTELAAAMLTGVSVIGVAESTSATAGLASQVTAALSGLGPLSVIHRQVSSQVTEAAAPAAPAAG